VKITAATDPTRHSGNGHPDPVSVIPAKVKATRDVRDVAWSTHRPAMATAKWAHANKLSCVLDFETQPAMLGNFYARPEDAKKHLAVRGAAVRQARRQFPGIQVGLYDMLKIGMARKDYKLREYVEFLRAEDKALNAVQFHVAEVYVDDLEEGDESGLEAMERWAAGVDVLMMAAAVEGATRVDLLLSPLYGVKGKGVGEWVYRPELFRAQLEHAKHESEGPSTAMEVRVQLWPWTDQGVDFAPGAWDIVSDYAGKRDTVAGGAGGDS
jgi:hypothetical protein